MRESGGPASSRGGRWRHRPWTCIARLPSAGGIEENEGSSLQGAGVRRIVYVQPTPYAQSLCRGCSTRYPTGKPKLAAFMCVLKPISTSAIPATASQFSSTAVYPAYSARHLGLPTLITRGSASRGSGHQHLAAGRVHTQDQTLIVATVRDRPPPGPVQEVR